VATAYANFSWNINNPSVAGNYPVTAVTDNMNAEPSVNSVFVNSCNPTSGSATATSGNYSVQQVSSDGGGTLKWKVVVNVNLSNVTAGGNGMASGSGQVQVDY
jgi:hypothetical protein